MTKKGISWSSKYLTQQLECRREFLEDMKTNGNW